MFNQNLWQEWVDFVPELNALKAQLILQKIALMRKAGRIIYPPQNQIFSFLNFCSPHDVSVIILGQDPYHGFEQAHGLAFSVNDHILPPPSLKNIFKEIKSDIYNNEDIKFCSNLTRLSKQGVLLLNCILTVEDSHPLSHQKLGWQHITTEILRKLSLRKKPIAVLLWGKFAQGYGYLFENSPHLVLKAAHPSPLSANRGFLGCKHFSKTNEFLLLHNRPAIQW